jgi:hypothetical protein
MNESITISEKVHQQFSVRAGLVGLGVKLRKRKVLDPLEQEVKIAQKTVKYTPLEKLSDGLIAILAGAQGLVEINKRVRADSALQLAFGREGCAEQSVVQDTLDACTTQNVVQMQEAVDQIYRQRSRGYRHDYQQRLQLLDIDTDGRPCGKKAAFATKGYFARRPNRRGRQEGYVLASEYEEIVVKRLFSGTTQRTTALQPLVEAAEKTLDLTPEKRQRTLLRIDSGGGSVDDVNWLLERGYWVHSKDYSGNRAESLAESVLEWIDDPRNTGRQVGWVTAQAGIYCRPVHRMAVRCPKKNGQWAVGVILSTLSPEQVLALTAQPAECRQDPQAVLLAYVYFYDLRGGGVETEIKEDKHGLGTAHRNKKRFAAQQMVCQLEVLAHNLLIWARTWLAPYSSKIARLGLLRLVRDALQVSGLIVFSQAASIQKIILNSADPLANELQARLAALLAQEHITVISGEI